MTLSVRLVVDSGIEILVERSLAWAGDVGVGGISRYKTVSSPRVCVDIVDH